MIGCGRMGGALAGAWARSHRVRALEPMATVPPQVERLERIDADTLPTDPVIVLAVKPQTFGDVAEMLRPLVRPGTVFVSIMAGVTTDTLRAALGGEAQVVRTMPNTPAAIGAGMTGAFAAAGVDDAARSAVTTLFGAVGDLVWLDQEAQFNTVTAVSGSGPAYFFRFAEALASAGEAAGLPPQIAARLARATLVGAGALAADGRATSLPELREAVTSPGGTTAAGLAAMEGVDALVDAVVTAAAVRSAELSAGTLS